jgi:predicted metal-dependent phosphoesterase TrpH
MKIDLHVHINRTSKCARCEPEEMALKAKEKGLDAICILDHHYYPNNEECKKAEDISGIKVFKAIEITVKAKEGGNDIIVISHAKPDFDVGAYHQPIPESRLPQLIDFVKRSQGISILAHPFRKNKPLAINPSGIDCIEIASKNTAVENREKILETSIHYNMLCVSASDAHKTRTLGHYCIDTDYDVLNELELAITLKRKHFTLLATQLLPLTLKPRNY